MDKWCITYGNNWKNFIFESLQLALNLIRLDRGVKQLMKQQNKMDVVIIIWGYISYNDVGNRQWAMKQEQQ